MPWLSSQVRAFFIVSQFLMPWMVTVTGSSLESFIELRLSLCCRSGHAEIAAGAVVYRQRHVDDDGAEHGERQPVRRNDEPGGGEDREVYRKLEITGADA